MRKTAVALIIAGLLAGCGLRPAPPPPVPEKTPELWTPSSTPEITPQRVIPLDPPTPRLSKSPAPPEPVAATGTTKTSVAASRHISSLGSSISNLPLELPSKPVPSAQNDSELQSLLQTAQYYGGAADWRKVAERALIVEDFSTASDAFKKEAAVYRTTGDIQAAIAEEIKAEQTATELRWYRSGKAAKPKYKLERMEPENGCYVGAFIDRDDRIRTHHFQSQTHGDIPQFNELVGKKHASFFMYRRYGHPFPSQWAEYVKSHGAIPHISWEPEDLADVQEDDYLERFIHEAKKLDHPVVLRFACEMNGKWTRYNGDPEAYKKAFRLVHKASRSAPKVMLLWCPNTVPRKGIEDYYPGDEYVDWVGVNFYSVPFLDNNPDRPGDKIHPTDQLDFVYQKFASRKPIAIGEWAASQQSSLTDEDLESFSIAKLGQLYSTLPTKYPRVKMVNWYDCNNIVKARQERQLNNFQVTSSETLLTAYKRAVTHPHYLGASQKKAKRGYRPAEALVELKPGEELRLTLKSYDPLLRVYFMVGDEVIHASDDPMEWFLSASQLKRFKEGKVKVVVFDSKNRFVTSTGVKFKAV